MLRINRYKEIRKLRERNNMKVSENDGKLLIFLEGRIDSNNAPSVEKDINGILDFHKGKDVAFDAGELTYISSAGLRVLMKVRKSFGKSLALLNVSRDVYDILETTGFTELFDVRRTYRQISVEGLPVIGRGFFGTVYRMDQETIVKVYKGKEAISMIENEKRMAQKAFVAGIPTAISYDIVKVGEDYGSVFELLDAKSFHDIVKDGDEPIEKVIRKYVGMLRLVHNTRMEKGDFPSYKDRFLNYLDVIREHLLDSQFEKLKNLLLNMPDENTVVHGDIQMKNVMLSGDEAMLIDMDTLGLGNPVFEFAGLFVTYREFAEDEPNNSRMFLQIPQEKADEIWQMTFDHYFDSVSDTDREKILEQIRLVAAIRFLYLLESTDLKNNTFGAKRIEHTREHIDELLNKVERLEVL